MSATPFLFVLYEVFLAAGGALECRRVPAVNPEAVGAPVNRHKKNKRRRGGAPAAVVVNCRCGWCTLYPLLYLVARAAPVRVISPRSESSLSVRISLYFSMPVFSSN